MGPARGALRARCPLLRSTRAADTVCLRAGPPRSRGAGRGTDGTGPAADADGPSSVVSDADAPPGGPLASPWRRLALGLAAGAAIGVTLVLTLDRPASPGRTAQVSPSSNTVPTVPAGPSESATPVPPVQDAALRPVVVDARGNGTSVSLEWTDPSGGVATFFVTQVGLPEPKIVASFPPGVTKGVVEGVDPSAKQVCYVVGASDDSSAATSAQRCLDPSPKFTPYVIPPRSSKRPASDASRQLWTNERTGTSSAAVGCKFPHAAQT